MKQGVVAQTKTSGARDQPCTCTCRVWTAEAGKVGGGRGEGNGEKRRTEKNLSNDDGSGFV